MKLTGLRNGLQGIKNTLKRFIPKASAYFICFYSQIVLNFVTMKPKNIL